MSQIPGGKPALIPKASSRGVMGFAMGVKVEEEDQHHMRKPREDWCPHSELAGELDILIGSASERDLFLFVLRDLVLLHWALAMSDPHAQGLRKSHFPHTGSIGKFLLKPIALSLWIKKHTKLVLN